MDACVSLSQRMSARRRPAPGIPRSFVLRRATNLRIDARIGAREESVSDGMGVVEL